MSEDSEGHKDGRFYSPKVNEAQFEEALRQQAGDDGTPESLKMFDNFKKGVQKSLLKSAAAEVQRRRRRSVEAAQLAVRNFETAGHAQKMLQNLLKVEYVKDERLNVWVEKRDSIPPPELFIPIGYDEDIDD